MISIKTKIGTYRYEESLAIGRKIDTTMVFENFAGQRNTLKNNGNNKPTLYFFIDQTHCSTCWGKALEILVSKFRSILPDRMVVLTSFRNFRDIVIPFKELKIDTNVYNIVQGEISPSLASIGLPLLITTDQNMRIDGMLIVDSDLIEQVEYFVRAFIEKNKINLVQ